MAVTITHTTPADNTFSAAGAAAWDATHAVSGLGTMAEQNANNVNITGGSISGVTGVSPATSGTSLLAGNGSGGFTNVTATGGLTYSAGSLTLTSSTQSFANLCLTGF